MDEKAYDEIVGRLKKASTVISALDPSIRGDAWDLLKPFVAGTAGTPPLKGNGDGIGDKNPAGDLNETALVEEHASDHDGNSNGLLISAILYGSYGLGPYKPKDFRKIGEAHLLLLPTWGNFLPRTKVGDKKLLRKSNDGWIITSDGAKWLSGTYGVRRGTQPRPE
jgi:hypothetical protein